MLGHGPHLVGEWCPLLADGEESVHQHMICCDVNIGGNVLELEMTVDDKAAEGDVTGEIHKDIAAAGDLDDGRGGC